MRRPGRHWCDVPTPGLRRGDQSAGPAVYENPTRNFVLSDNWAATPSILNEFRFGYTTSDLGTYPSASA